MMERKLNADTDELLRRAREDTPDRGHRYVYSESTSRPASGYAVRPNKKGTARKVSTFYLIVTLLCVGIAIVAYVNNVIVVNRLAGEINQMQTIYNKIINDNAVLRSEINRKSAWERIGKMAGDQGLQYPKTPPTFFEVDPDLVEQAQSVSAAGQHDSVK